MLAVFGLRRADEAPWAPHLSDALRATRAVAEQAAAFSVEDGAEGLRDLWTLLDVAPPAHPTGLPGSTVAGRTCGGCAFRGRGGRCRQAGMQVRPGWAACERWEPELDCQECGACCRAAYDCVQVSRRDPVRRTHPELVVRRGPFLELQRQGDRCAALHGGRSEQTADGTRTLARWSCAIYDDRPRSCREFERGGAHCLTARRRVGLTL
jgi:hypothetical protein